jgi:hypothetical protein
MSSQLTHERCSELLSDYLAGELNSEQRRLVKDHLEHCAQCSVERAGLAALRTAEEGEGLTGDERAMLRAGVLEAVRDSSAASSPLGLQDESDAVVVPLRRRGSRASKYLGIAAMLAILAVGSLVVLRGGGLGVSGAGDGEAGSGGGAELSTEEDTDQGVAGNAAPTPAQGELDYAWDLQPKFRSASGAISEEDLDTFGRQSSTLFDDMETTTDEAEKEELSSNHRRSALRASRSALGRLAEEAPASLAPDVTECGLTALDALGRPGFATSATTATIEDEDVIVIAFVTGERSPDRYAVFAFPRGDCTTIHTSTEGPLE